MMIVNYLVVSLLAWLIGVLLAGGLGYGCALIGRKWLLASPSRARLMALLPWRTLLIIVLLLLPSVPMAFGLGDTSNVIIAGLVIFLIGLPVSTTYFLEAWNPSSRLNRLIGAARSLVVLSIVVALFGTMFTGGTALGMMYIRGLQELNRAELSSAFWSIFFMMLALDLLFGAAQLILLPKADA